jgi:hypothetical protein
MLQPGFVFCCFRWRWPQISATRRKRTPDSIELYVVLHFDEKSSGHQLFAKAEAWRIAASVAKLSRLKARQESLVLRPIYVAAIPSCMASKNIECAQNLQVTMT